MVTALYRLEVVIPQILHFHNQIKASFSQNSHFQTGVQDVLCCKLILIPAQLREPITLSYHVNILFNVSQGYYCYTS